MSSSLPNCKKDSGLLLAVSADRWCGVTEELPAGTLLTERLRSSVPIPDRSLNFRTSPMLTRLEVVRLIRSVLLIVRDCEKTLDPRN